MLLSRFIVGMLSVGLMVIGVGTVSGQTYPAKPIRIVAGTPGGGGDFTARLVAQGIAGPLGQPVIIDNRSSLLTSDIVAKSPPDGYTLLVHGAAVWLTPLLQKMPYDVVRDLSPVSLLVREVLVVAVHPSLPVKSVKELIALAKAKPGELNYSAGSTGGITHLAPELFKSMAGVNILHVAYRGNLPALTGLMSGEVHLLILDASLLAPHMKSGKVKALAVTTAQPSALVPGLPTVAASGLPGYEVVGTTVMFAPAKTPAAIINRLNQEIVGALNLPDVKQKFFDSGVEVVGSSPEQLAATVKSEIAKMGKVIKDTGIKAD